MTDVTTRVAKHSEITADEVRGVKFAKAFGRGYELNEVDAFVDRCAAWVEWFTEQLRSAKQEIAQLQEQVFSATGADQVKQAISVLTNAQQTADTTVRQADQYSARVMAEAKELYEDARNRTATLERETEVKANALWNDAAVRAETLEREVRSKADALYESATERAGAMEREAKAQAQALQDDAEDRVAALDAETEARMAQLGVTAALKQKELDSQTAYLRTLRDASRVQMQKFLEGLLDHITDEYGRANPVAAEAAAEPKRQPIGGSSAPRRAIGGRKRAVRRSYRVAGLPPAADPAPAMYQAPEPLVPEPRRSGEASAMPSVVNGSTVYDH